MNLAIMTPFPWHVSGASDVTCAGVVAADGTKVAFCYDYRAAELIVGLTERITELEQEVEKLEDRKKDTLCINQTDAKLLPK